MLGKNSTSVLYMTKPVVLPLCLLQIQEYTQDGNLSDILKVEKLSSWSPIPFAINYLIREAMSINVAIVIKHFPRSQLLTTHQIINPYLTFILWL